ncbi:MAG: hypothetical protein D6736_20300, partial [Nitrospinota bacterium]
MECWEVQKLLDALVDEEVDAATRVVLEDHLDGCERCRKSLAFQRQVKQLLQMHARRVRVPATLHKRLLARLDALEREESRLEPFWRRYLFPPIWVPALVTLLLIGVFFWRERFHSPPPWVQEAVATYAHYLKKPATVGIASTEAEEVRRWLSAQLAFPV